MGVPPPPAPPVRAQDRVRAEPANFLKKEHWCWTGRFFGCSISLERLTEGKSYGGGGIGSEGRGGSGQFCPISSGTPVSFAKSKVR